eukprot:Amastigsp_a1246_3.p3 type:complete len:126 gc:universal Amastigsp_a1246_3:424-47(-)
MVRRRAPNIGTEHIDSETMLSTSLAKKSTDTGHTISNVSHDHGSMPTTTPATETASSPMCICSAARKMGNGRSSVSNNVLLSSVINKAAPPYSIATRICVAVLDAVSGPSAGGPPMKRSHAEDGP